MWFFNIKSPSRVRNLNMIEVYANWVGPTQKTVLAETYSLRNVCKACIWFRVQAYVCVNVCKAYVYGFETFVDY